MSNPNPQNQFQKGETGNPKGRPKRDWTWTGLMEQVAEESSVDGKTKKEILINKLYELALSGDVVAMKEILNRMDGTPTKSILAPNEEELPAPIMGGLSFNVISYKDAVKQMD